MNESYDYFKHGVSFFVVLHFYLSISDVDLCLYFTVIKPIIISNRCGSRFTGSLDPGPSSLPTGTVWCGFSIVDL